MAKNVKKLFALILTIAMVMSLSVNAFAAEGDISLDKTADWSDEKYVADVTLSVGGDAEALGVDISYIVGGYLKRDQVEADLMIESLYSTFVEIVGAGTPVNFGFVPFSYDDRPVMELTPYNTLADLEANFHDDLRAAIDAASGMYGGENMDNALQVAKNMFASSELADHPERQHLILVSSGHTYNFNSGKNNDIFSTVPVAIDNSKDFSKLFFGFKAWMQARNTNPNTYPIPKAFTEYEDSRDWDAYWADIEEWAADDIDNGDVGLYEICDTTDYSYTYYDWYMDNLKSDSTHNNKNGLYKSYGSYIYTASEEFVEAAYGVKVGSLATSYDQVAETAKHAISYERAMWEASTFIDDEITGEGINFYPIYNQMKAQYTNGYDGTALGCTWTDQYIGHSFMDMLARNVGMDEAVNNSNATDKAFFDPIKNEILYAVSAGSYVEDYMGYGDEYDFDFIDEIENITLKVGSVEYTTAKLETATEGFDSSYAFTAPEATEPTFWLDYVKGNGTSEEMFKWTYGENIYTFAPVVLDYQVRLVASPAVLVDDLVCETNKIATLYPEGGDPEEFPVPEVKLEPVTYTVTYIDRDEEVQYTDDLATGDEIPGCEDPESYTQGSYKYTFKKWKLIEGKEGADGTIGTTDLVYESVYSRSKTSKPITPSNPEIEIPDDEIPLAEIPELFGDDHYAYIIGYPDGMVHPEGQITRAEVATIFFRLLAEDVRTALMTDVNDFSDVEKGQWYNHAVSTLSSIGVILGRSDGSFDPNAYITRAEFAAIAARFDPTGNPEGVFFTDIAGHWAEREIIIAANNGWVEGYNGLFRPNDYITRAEAMTLVNRVLHRLPETEHDLLEYMVTWPDNMDVNVWYYLAVQEATNSHDYVRKTDPIYESWTEFIEPYDWSLLEY